MICSMRYKNKLVLSFCFFSVVVITPQRFGLSAGDISYSEERLVDDSGA